MPIMLLLSDPIALCNFVVMRMRTFLLFLCLSKLADAQQIQTLYLLPGQGSDHRIYSHTTFPEGVDTVHLHFIMPLENESMHAYAARMSAQIDTTRPFAIAGVSLGGMVATEMTDFIHPQLVILLSSASSSEEIPDSYAQQREYMLYRWIPAGVIKYSTFLLQPMFEPDRRKERAICNDMISDKSALFMKRAVHLIVTWDRPEAQNAGLAIFQIHGSADQTLPLKNIAADLIISDGSHMMTLTKAAEISQAIQQAFTTHQQ